MPDPEASAVILSVLLAEIFGGIRKSTYGLRLHLGLPEGTLENIGAWDHVLSGYDVKKYYKIKLWIIQPSTDHDLCSRERQRVLTRKEQEIVRLKMPWVWKMGVLEFGWNAGSEVTS